MQKKVDLKGKLNAKHQKTNNEQVFSDTKPRKEYKEKKRLLKNKKIIKLKKFKEKDKELEEEISYKYEQELLDDEILGKRKERIREQKAARIQKIIQLVLIFSCVYLVFLIYGVSNTKYVYDDKGAVVPQTMSVQQIRDLGEFDKLAVQYRQARALYEQVLALDYRVGAGIEDVMLIAPEYEKLLDQINSLIIQLGAINVPTEYSQVLNMLNSWATNDIAIYCQNMSTAISQNSSEHASRALEYKDIMYQNFSLLTHNIAIMGAKVDGADILDIVEWSPEWYVENEIGGVLKYE